MRSLLTGVRPDMIRTDPFPHIVIHDALDAEDYAALCAGYPSLGAIIGTDHARFRSNRRYAMMATWVLASPDLPACWHRFVRTHTTPAFLAEVEALFDGYWPPALLSTLGGRLSGHMTELLQLGDGSKARIQMDARLEVNTPVLDVPSRSRGPHLDTPNRLYSGLFYLRHPDDDSVGGDLELFRWREGATRRTDVVALPDDAVERVATIPYRPNTLVMFPQGIDALHGVGIRQPTPHVRRYVFITAEITENWLVPPDRRSEVP
ncbi:hypothetical protein CHU95_02240 [Niveispirillum lacus]|uniref:Prolyl 4-hydroxylase alpha subunit Fe(2+) 2OG dioxygenase domain-containing protein n=1 Tax=Niveispirillum lacus TaxID=1981099 RepID=A0A255Z6T5_9PROT|nr:2OG-Fe(II) oxygenase [Niveispirillum lacus]OYQ37188.1 hypothetical protein CHU95_02240 [Niveispirillum lacus]